MMATNPWVPFERRADTGFENELAISCYLGKAYYWWSERNAYFGSRSRRYQDPDAFKRTFASVASAIEASRAQGTQWRIDEMPLLVIAGARHYLLIGEINTDAPLHGFLSSRRRFSSLDEAGRMFASDFPDTVVRLISADQIAPARLPFQTLPRRSARSRQRLGWSTSRSEVDLDPILRLVARFNKALQRRSR
jgi:hypothetical protein